MAEVYNNDKRHLVIKMNNIEATKLGFGVQITGLNNMCICGSCNEECKPEEIYYIAGINEVMCKDCVDDYIKNMNHCNDKDSIIYEISHFNNVALKLGMKIVAMLSKNGKVTTINKEEEN